MGETIVAADGDEIVGVITLNDAEKTHGSPFYDRHDVALFGQFAVRPLHKGRGICSKLIDLVEQRAAEKGIAELGLDTSSERPI